MLSEGQASDQDALPGVEAHRDETPLYYARCASTPPSLLLRLRSA